MLFCCSIYSVVESDALECIHLLFVIKTKVKTNKEYRVKHNKKKRIESNDMNRIETKYVLYISQTKFGFIEYRFRYVDK